MVTRVATTERAVALTFDTAVDTPGNVVTGVLRELRADNARATFSVTGVWGEQQRDLLFSMAADGHQVINGTYDGASFTGASTGTAPLSPEERKLALSRAEVTVYRYTSRSTRPYVRLPHGDMDESVLRDAAANGYPIAVGWAADVPADTPAAEMVPLVMDAAAPGVIIRLPLSTAAADALPNIIDALREAGYELLTVDELLAR